MDIEGKIASECDRQGVRPTPEIFRQMIVETIGRVTEHGYIHLDAGSISVKNFVESYRSANPDSFVQAGDKSKFIPKPGETLTDQYKREIAESRSRKPLSSDWEAVRSRMQGLTREMMDEISESHRKGEALR